MASQVASVTESAVPNNGELRGAWAVLEDRSTWRLPFGSGTETCGRVCGVILHGALDEGNWKPVGGTAV